MNKLLQRWLLLAPREQWLSYGVALAVVGMLYMLLVGDPLTQRVAKQTALNKAAVLSLQEAQLGLADLQTRLAVDPNVPYRSALLTAKASGEQLIGEVDQDTAGLLPPEKMRAVLQELLRAQPKLRLLSLQSFTEPLQLAQTAPQPNGAIAKGAAVEPKAPVTLYRYGLKISLQGGYFDLLTYLQAIQASGWRLHWDSLDYQVGSEGPAQAKINLVLYTLSREAGWIGV
ncbi:MAG: MSHA biogenesis protein MshJ [Pseudomonadaceae bacterium]|nr:MSHA biogenesis protein MshJ [Pseudomonadaceae bacterium]